MKCGSSDPKGEQLGVMPLHEALKQVEALELDLVEVAPDAQPPVCRMMDYGKFRYEQKKKSHGPKKHSVVEIKEVKMGSRTDAHDVVHKVRNIRQFIGKGQRVKVSVFFRGREITHPELGRQMLTGRGRSSPRRCQSRYRAASGRTQHGDAVDAQVTTNERE